MKLSQQEKRTRILIAIGWSLVNIYQWDEANPSIRLPKQFHVDKCGVIHNAPDVFSDLNAMHEAEKWLDDDQRMSFMLTLADIACSFTIGKVTWTVVDKMLAATASQRAEAFGLTLNLWEAGE